MAANEPPSKIVCWPVLQPSLLFLTSSVTCSAIDSSQCELSWIEEPLLFFSVFFISLSVFSMLFWHLGLSWMWSRDRKCFFFGIVIRWSTDLTLETVDELELLVRWIITFTCGWSWVLFKTLSVLVSSITPSYVTIGIISSRGRNCFIWDDFFATVRGGSCSLISFVPLSEIWRDLFLLFVFEWRVWPLGREGTLSSSELLL